MAIKLQPTSSFAKMIIVAELVLVSYLLYTLTVSVYKSYQIELYIKSFEEENRLIAEENLKKSEDYEYFSSENYIEKIAKQNWGLVNYGEEVIVIPNSNAGTTGLVGGLDQTEQQEENIRVLNNPQKWWIFFFDRH